MSTVMIEITSVAAFISNPESEEGRLQNLYLNMMGGLDYKDLADDEKQLLARHGYKNNKPE